MKNEREMEFGTWLVGERRIEVEERALVEAMVRLGGVSNVKVSKSVDKEFYHSNEVRGLGFETFNLSSHKRVSRKFFSSRIV